MHGLGLVEISEIKMKGSISILILACSVYQCLAVQGKGGFATCYRVEV